MTTALTTNGLICGPNAATSLVTSGLICPVLEVELEVVDKFVHITNIMAGDTLRIATKAGRHLEPHLRGKKTPVLKPGRAPTGRSLRAKAFSRTVVMFRVLQNDTQTGKLTGYVQGRKRSEINEAELFYTDIKNVQKYISPNPDKLNIDQTRALSDALNVNNPFGMLKLIPVRF